MDNEQKKQGDAEDGVKPDELPPEEAAAKEEAAGRAERSVASFSWGERVGYGF